MERQRDEQKETVSEIDAKHTQSALTQNKGMCPLKGGGD